MKSRLIFYFILFSILTGKTQNSFAQDKFFIPVNIKKAYEKQTRSLDGTPGEYYWQNASRYKIKVNVAPNAKLISGIEEIEYFNNSPDTLKEIIIRLYQNVYKPGAERDFSIANQDLTEGISLTKFDFNHAEIKTEGNIKFNIAGTNLFFKPDAPILPHSKSHLKLEWNFKLSSRNMRMGIYDSTSFFIAYWYPQISVYDDIDGWDKTNYTGTQEFYNDYSDYEVEVSVPNKFGVWGTGILNNPEELLTGEYLNRYKEAHNSEQVIKIISPEDLGEKNIYDNREEFNTWKFKADNVSDFSFALSDHYLWDALTINAGKDSDKPVFISAVYKKESLDFYEVAGIAKRSVEYFSESLPGVVFPYPALTIFNGGNSGMEYPMMVNDASFSSNVATFGTTSHEIVHQYFPFYVGTNERKYAFMDEGMAVMLPMDFQEMAIEGNFPRERNTNQYENLAGKEMDMPPMIPSVLLKGQTYRIASYNRPGLAYYFLREAIGNELFDKALQKYIALWNGKHPTPYDFFYTFNNAAGKNLDWFWLPWFFERAYPDLAIKSADLKKNTIHVVIEKRGTIPLPLKLLIQQNKKPEDSYIPAPILIYKTAAVWESGNNEFSIDYEIPRIEGNIDLFLGSSDIPDIDQTNNNFNLKGIEP
jgi:hypothetical protein